MLCKLSALIVLLIISTELCAQPEVDFEDQELIDWAVATYQEALTSDIPQFVSLDFKYYQGINEPRVLESMHAAVVQGGLRAQNIIKAFCGLSNEKKALDYLWETLDHHDVKVQNLAYLCLYFRDIDVTLRARVVKKGLESTSSVLQELAALNLRTLDPKISPELFRLGLASKESAVVLQTLESLGTRDRGELDLERAAVKTDHYHDRLKAVAILAAFQLSSSAEPKAKESFIQLCLSSLNPAHSRANGFEALKYLMRAGVDAEVREKTKSALIRDFLQASDSQHPIAPVEENVKYGTRNRPEKDGIAKFTSAFAAFDCPETFELFVSALSHSNQYVNRGALLALSKNKFLNGQQIAKLIKIIIDKKPDAKLFADREAWLLPIAEIYKNHGAKPELVALLGELRPVLPFQIFSLVLTNLLFDTTFEQGKDQLANDYQQDPNWQVRFPVVGWKILYRTKESAAAIKQLLKSEDAYTQLLGAHAILLYAPELLPSAEQTVRAWEVIRADIFRPKAEAPVLRLVAGQPLIVIDSPRTLGLIEMTRTSHDSELIEMGINAIAGQTFTPDVIDYLRRKRKLTNLSDRFLYARAILVKNAKLIPDRSHFLQTELRTIVEKRIQGAFGS